MIEELERRQHLTATLDGGDLVITGTGKNDLITLAIDAADASMLDVRIRNDVTSFDLAAVQRIFIQSFGGDDRIFFNQQNGAIRIDSRIYAGSGNDSVLGGAGRDRVYGGNGNDTIFGGTGRDIIYAEFGDDSILGEAGDDYLSGDAGDDTIRGGDGNDRIFSGDGLDDIDGETGDDNISG